MSKIRREETRESNETHPPHPKILLSPVPCIISDGLNTKLHCPVMLGGPDIRLNLFPLSYETQ